MSETGTICLEGVSKRFRRGSAPAKSYSSIKSMIFGGGKSADVNPKFTAIDDISFKVERGSSLGVIGRNGSGKSTLLKLISKIYRPDEGKVTVTGRVSALIELGAGFHPEFTGRENVFLGGAMFGLSKKEVEKILPDILSFAELEHVIDEPVRTYSSGMFMRLGFSLAVHTNPDVLLVDEVLSVGDAPFVSRCKERIGELRRRGVTLLLVSHDLNAVRSWCDEVLWLSGGKISLRGRPEWVIDSYLEKVESIEDARLIRKNKESQEATTDEDDVTEQNPADSKEPSSWGNKDVEITSVSIWQAGAETWVLHSEEAAEVKIKYKVNKEVSSLVFGVGIYRVDGFHVLGTNTDIDGLEIPVASGEVGEEREISFSFERLSLGDNTYYVDIAAHREDGLPYDYHHWLHKFTVKTATSRIGVFSPESSWKLA